MTPPDRDVAAGGGLRPRREPPPYRQVEVRGVERVTPRLLRVTLGGPGLAGFAVEQPAASVRLLLPTPGSDGLVMPAWNGNEFLLPDGRRPTLRTLTPRRVDAERSELVVEIVVHEGGVASAWALAAAPGAPAAISGPGRGYDVDVDAPAFLLAGDETAIPAIGQLLEAIPDGRRVRTIVELAVPSARVALPAHPGATVDWLVLGVGATAGDAMVGAVLGTDLAPGTRVWAAGEAAAVQRIRRHLFDERGLPRAHAWVRGYWKHGRAGDAEADAGLAIT